VTLKQHSEGTTLMANIEWRNAYFMGDLKGEPPEPDVVLTLVARGTWATRGIVGELREACRMD
jgi:hypothetical protein